MHLRVATLWAMGKATWWVCDDCKSLNDLPANKCYNCRTARPVDPVLIDDQYDQVNAGAKKRVGISVDLSQVGSLIAPDPLERQQGGSIMEAFPQALVQPSPGSEDAGQPAPSIPPIRPPKTRGIAEVGGLHWTEEGEARVDPIGESGTPDARARVLPPQPGLTPPVPPAPAAPPPGQSTPAGLASRLAPRGDAPAPAGYPPQTSQVYPNQAPQGYPPQGSAPRRSADASIEWSAASAWTGPGGSADATHGWPLTERCDVCGLRTAWCITATLG